MVVCEYMVFEMKQKMKTKTKSSAEKVHNSRLRCCATKLFRI